MPAWLGSVLLVVAVLIVWLLVGFVASKRAYKRLAQKRASPDRQRFLEMLGNEVDHDVGEWVWRTVSAYYLAPVAPHPDDHLIEDAKIDSDDIDMEWIPLFIADMGMDRSIWPGAWPDWPERETLTVRNFARHLQEGRDRLG